MKNLKFKRLLSLLLVIVMIISSSAFMTLTVSAGEGPPEGAQVEDMYSSWAYWDIFMAQNVYNLGNEGTYSNFRGGFVWMKFTPVLKDLAEKFNVKWSNNSDWIDTDSNNPITRGETIKSLYYIIGTILVFEEINSDGALDYFVENGLINGRKSGDYQLDENCTTEEMIVFSVRVYEHIARELGLDSKGFFWKVTGEKNTVYLLGSVHISDESLYPFNKAIENAFDKSDYLAVEVDIFSETEEDIDYYFEKAFISDGTTIEDYIDPEMYEAYAYLCEMVELPQEIYDYVYPWYASIMLDQIAMGIIFGGEDVENLEDIYESFENIALLGIDNHFMYKALSQNKDIIGLESSKMQVDMLASFSPELQEAMLFGSLYNIYYNIILNLSDFKIIIDFDSLNVYYEDEPAENAEDTKDIDEAEDAEEADETEKTEDTKETEKTEVTENVEDTTDISSILDMLAVFKSGDEKVLGEYLGVDIVGENPIDIEYNYKMLTERNIGMTEKIIEFLTEGESDYFVVVGAAHMLGKEGIVQLLIDAGYKVERIK